LLCDILIRPSTPGASTLTFGLADSIIRTGERFARAQWIPLKKLADQMNNYSSSGDKPVIPLPKVDSVYVRELSFTGLNKISSDFVQSKMNLPFPAWLTAGDIFRALQRVYGTNDFNKVTYQIDPVTNGVRLTIRVEEKEQNLVHVGLHFDNLFNASLLARADFRNLLKTGDQLGVDLNLGENPNINSSYFFLFRKKQQYGLIADFGRLKAYEFQNNQRYRSVTYRNGAIDLVMRSTYRNLYAVTAGIQGEMAWISPNISDWQIKKTTVQMVNFYLQFKKDNFNKSPYPTKGVKSDLTLKEVNNFTENGNLPSLILDLRYRRAFELSPKFSLQPSVFATLTLGDSIPYPYRSYIGGLGYYNRSVVPFVGMDYMERASNQAIILRTDLQYRIRGNHYLILKMNVGKSFDTFNQFTESSTNLAGIGMTYGYASPVGPIEITLMGSTTSSKPILFINLGYWIR
jgi:NTE family protein